MQTLRSTAEWANAIAGMAAEGRLHRRTVLVPRERVAHALRRELVRAGRADALIGTRFVRPAALAFEMLRAVGANCVPGEEALRVLRIFALLRRGVKLKHFPLELLRSRPGWDEAFASAIAELEGAGLRPEQIDVSGNKQLADVVMVWRAIDELAGPSWTDARILLEAKPAAAPGAVLGALSGHESAVEAQFVRRIPGLQLAAFAAGPAATSRQRDVLAAHLFATPPSRPSVRDGSVILQEHAGVEEEVEAAAQWAARRIFDDGLSLEEVAIVAPAADPWVSLLAVRLRRLDWPGETLPVYVAGGLPLVETAAGARLLSLLRALRTWLPLEAVADLIPSLRSSEGGHLDRSSAIALASALGTAGGNAARQEGALEWGARVRARREELPAVIAAEQNPRRSAHLAWQQECLEAVAPAFEGLAVLAAQLSTKAPLKEIAASLSAFAESYLLQPGAPAMPALHAAVEELSRSALGGELAGMDALDVLLGCLASLRVPTARFGQPALYVGTVQGAVGLPFRAVRFIGLAEGTIPGAPRENAVLPSPLRAQLGLRSAAARVQAQLDAVARVVRDAADHVAFSAPRVGPDGTQREPSSLFLEIQAALGAPRLDLKTLRKDAIRPARVESESAALRRSVSGIGALWRVARAGGPVPAAWLGGTSTDPRRIRQLLQQEDWSPADGILGLPVPGRPIPGSTAERSISASRLATLLKCPHQFLLENLLGWREPAELPSLGGLDPLTYGSLFHSAVEEFFRLHGEAFGARKKKVDHWQQAAAGLAGDVFERFAGSYPFGGKGIRSQQKARLLRDVQSLVEYDWQGEARRFVAVERAFGDVTPLKLALQDDHVVHLTGFIDRIDVEGDHALVRDWKTGRSKPRRGDLAEPNMGVDLQVAIYGMVAQQLSKEWGVPRKVEVAYVYPERTSDPERAFRADFKTLATSARAWLSTGAALVSEGVFPRSPDSGDCRYCQFKPVCGDDAPARSRHLLEQSEGALGDFVRLRIPEAT